MTRKITVHHPDQVQPLIYDAAPPQICQAIRRRFELGIVIAIHPSKPNVYIVDPGNWWDGPTHVTWESESGHFTFAGWHGDEHFPMIGPLR